MGFFDIFKKKKMVSNTTSDHSHTANSLGGVCEIIDTLWGEDGVKTVVANSKSDIQSIITEEGVRRKTELRLQSRSISQ